MWLWSTWTNLCVSTSGSVPSASHPSSSARLWDRFAPSPDGVTSTKAESCVTVSYCNISFNVLSNSYQQFSQFPSRRGRSHHFMPCIFHPSGLDPVCRIPRGQEGRLSRRFRQPVGLLVSYCCELNLER